MMLLLAWVAVLAVVAGAEVQHLPSPSSSSSSIGIFKDTGLQDHPVVGNMSFPLDGNWTATAITEAQTVSIVGQVSFTFVPFACVSVCACVCMCTFSLSLSHSHTLTHTHNHALFHTFVCLVQRFPAISSPIWKTLGSLATHCTSSTGSTPPSGTSTTGRTLAQYPCLHLEKASPPPLILQPRKRFLTHEAHISQIDRLHPSFSTDTTLLLLPPGEEYLLVFDGVKMAAEAFVNGRSVQIMTDQFLRYVINMTDVAVEGENHVSVTFDSSLDVNGRFMAWSVECPCVCVCVCLCLCVCVCVGLCVGLCTQHSNLNVLFR